MSVLYTQYGSLDATQSLEGGKGLKLLLGNKLHPPAAASGEAATPLQGKLVDSGIRGDEEEFFPSNRLQLHGGHIARVFRIQLSHGDHMTSHDPTHTTLYLNIKIWKVLSIRFAVLIDIWDINYCKIGGLGAVDEISVYVSGATKPVHSQRKATKSSELHLNISL